MQVTHHAWIHPVTVRGRGIPFAPHRMWQVIETADVDGRPSPAVTTGALYWSKRVPERIAQEQARSASERLRHIAQHYVLTC